MIERERENESKKECVLAKECERVDEREECEIGRLTKTERVKKEEGKRM